MRKVTSVYYDQAVLQGMLLVAVEVHGYDQASRLDRASQILVAQGARPLPLDVG